MDYNLNFFHITLNWKPNIIDRRGKKPADNVRVQGPEERIIADGIKEVQKWTL